MTIGGHPEHCQESVQPSRTTPTILVTRRPLSSKESRPPSWAGLGRLGLSTGRLSKLLHVAVARCAVGFLHPIDDHLVDAAGAASVQGMEPGMPHKRTNAPTKVLRGLTDFL